LCAIVSGSPEGGAEEEEAEEGADNDGVTLMIPEEAEADGDGEREARSKRNECLS
jgi:hypothetical protein